MTREREFLTATGMMSPTVYAGIQQDVCAVWKNVAAGSTQASLCNHDCLIQLNGKPTGGQYTCDSSFSLNSGCKSQFASRQVIVSRKRLIANAHEIVREIFFANHFNSYCEEFQIPPVWADAIKDESLDPKKKMEDNNFGGSPEMLKDISGIIADSKAAGFVCNLTTPGRRFMQDAQFVKDIAVNPPHMIAVSFDDVEADELTKLAKMSLEELKAEWRKVPVHHGQRQKAYEGLYTARLVREQNIQTTILFNMVIHPGNVKHFESLLDVLRESVPGSNGNPYPGQAFNEEKTCWTLESLPYLRAHIVSLTEKTLQKPQGITRRLHYYIVLESAFRAWRRKDPERLMDFMGGIRAWDSTRRPGAYLYAQVGKSLGIFASGSNTPADPGGHLGCYWNPEWAFPKSIDKIGTAELAQMMITGVVERGRQLQNFRKTHIMPRLMFNVVATELGLPSELIPEYLATRKEYAGY